MHTVNQHIARIVLTRLTKGVHNTRHPCSQDVQTSPTVVETAVIHILDTGSTNDELVSAANMVSDVVDTAVMHIIDFQSTIDQLVSAANTGSNVSQCGRARCDAHYAHRKYN